MPLIPAGTQVRITRLDRRTHGFEESEFPFDGTEGIDFVAECRTFGEVVEVDPVHRACTVRVTDFEGALEADLEVTDEDLASGRVVLL